MSAVGNPFVVEEAEIFLYLSDNTAVWIGGCANNLSPNKELTEHVVEQQGEIFGTVKHVNEAHTIEIENVWLLDTSGGSGMPRIERDIFYAMVIIWYDYDTDNFVKFTYYGVTGRSQKIGERALQNLVYRAQSRFEETDNGTYPSILPSVPPP